MLFDLETLKLILAAWGALTGTRGTTIGVLAWLRDRSRLSIRLSTITAKAAERIRPEFKRLDSEAVALVEAVNIGRRVRYVYRPELWVTNDYLLSPVEPHWVFAGGEWSREMKPWQSWRLEEAQSVTFVFGLGKKRKIARAYIPDGLGRKPYFTPFKDRWRWLYGKKKGQQWKEVRDIFFERRPTRHNDDD